MPTQIIDQNPMGSVFVYHTCNGINIDTCIHIMHFEDHDDGYLMDVSIPQAKLIVDALNKAIDESVEIQKNTVIV